jgi:hypothetical protein
MLIVIVVIKVALFCQLSAYYYNAAHCLTLLLTPSLTYDVS